MTDRRIDDLTAITEGNLSGSDLLLVSDISAAESKKILLSELETKFADYQEISQPVFQNVAAVGVWGDLGSLTLPPGDWEIYVVFEINNNGATTGDSNYDAGISTGSGTLFGDALTAFTRFGGIANGGYKRVNLTVSTTYYFKYRNSGYTVATPQMRGKMSARRFK